MTSVLIYKKVLCIDICEFFKKTFIAFLPIYILFVVTNIALNYLIDIEGWLSVGIKGLTFVTIMSLSLYSLVMNKEEKKFISSLIKSITHKLR